MTSAAHLHAPYIALAFTWFDIVEFYSNRYSAASTSPRRQAARNQQARVYNEQRREADVLKASWHMTTDTSAADDRDFETELDYRHAHSEWLGVGGIQI